MTRSAVVVVVAVLVVAVGFAPGVAAGTTPYADPAAVCEGESQQLVILLENGEKYLDDVTLFTGTEARLVYCSAESGGNPAETTDAWGVGDVDGLEVREENNWSITVEVVGQMDGVDLAEHVEQKAADRTVAPTLTAVEPGGTDTKYLESPSEVHFSESSTRESFVDRRSKYSAAVADAESLSERLDAAAAADDPAGELDSSTVAAVDDRLTAVDNASSDVEQLFVSAAVDGDGDGTEAYLAQQAHSSEVATDLESSADDYVAAVESQATDARLLLTAVLLGPFVAGVLVGSLGGRAVSRRDLKRVRRQRRRDQTVDYSLRNLWKVFVGATVAVLAGVAVVVVGVPLGELIAVIS